MTILKILFKFFFFILLDNIFHLPFIFCLLSVCLHSNSSSPLSCWKIYFYSRVFIKMCKISEARTDGSITQRQILQIGALTWESLNHGKAVVGRGQGGSKGRGQWPRVGPVADRVQERVRLATGIEVYQYLTSSRLDIPSLVKLRLPNTKWKSK